MSEKNRSASVTKMPAPRVGEGVLVDLKLRPVKEKNGDISATSVAVEADISAAPVPNKRYAADVWSLLVKSGVFKLMFAQERVPTNDGLRNLIVVNMPAISVQQFLESVATVQIGQKNGKFVVQPEAAFDIIKEPKDTVAFVANLVATSSQGHECCVDFYHASPFSKGLAYKLRKLALDPIVRVDMRTAMLTGIIEAMKVALAGMTELEIEG